MKVLWPHNFAPSHLNSQIFINITADGLRANGIDIQFEYLGNLRAIRNILNSRRRLKQLQKYFDLVHVQYGSASAFVVGKAINMIPKILTIRGNDWNLHSTSVDFHYFHTRLARLMTYCSLNRYDCIIAVSNRLAQEIRRYTNKSKVFVLPTPIDLKKFIPYDKDEARRMLGFSDFNQKWVLFNAINLNDPIKRFSLAQKAFALANKKMGNLRFCVANNVPHSLIPQFTSACDVILCTSETEGWPNSVKEALACNVPFVSTNVGDLSDIAREEPTCRICPPDPYILADNICDVLHSERPKNLRRFVAEMDVTVISKRLFFLYREILSNQE